MKNDFLIYNFDIDISFGKKLNTTANYNNLNKIILY